MSDHVAFTDQPAVRWGAATDVGLVRAGNEDAFVSEPMVFGVADGMGGHQAGEVASEIAARIIRDRLGTGATNVGVVVASVVEANASIYQAAHASADHQGMGTTLTALVVMRADESNVARFALVNVGDSRTYLLRNGELHRATVDHSYVQELVNTGHISEDEARTHPRRNIVTRALGIEPTVRVDTWLVPMVHGDRFILCSDGLVDEVHDDDIAEIAARRSPIRRSCADQLDRQGQRQRRARQHHRRRGRRVAGCRTDRSRHRARIRTWLAGIRVDQHDDRCRRQQRADALPASSPYRAPRFHRSSSSAGTDAPTADTEQLGDAPLPEVAGRRGRARHHRRADRGLDRTTTPQRRRGAGHDRRGHRAGHDTATPSRPRTSTSTSITTTSPTTTIVGTSTSGP